jgi:hypothetical protein
MNHKLATISWQHLNTLVYAHTTKREKCVLIQMRNKVGRVSKAEFRPIELNIGNSLKFLNKRVIR